ncbi:type II toxin-antitoxin system Phd/YefM family antitoxin [bacterium]|nr:MAG: type II toxin-antitoxin system Phd/YefM family antitoxin [bacterium]
MELDFKVLSMMDLRSSPGEILDKVCDQGEAYIIERNGQQKACLVPISLFFPDIPKSRLIQDFNALRESGENPTLRFSDNKELEVFLKNEIANSEVTLKIVLPHRYPNAAPRVYASPIRADSPHRWQDGALCIFGTMTNWNPGKHDLVSALNLSRNWLANYSEWCETSKWPAQKEAPNEQ